MKTDVFTTARSGVSKIAVILSDGWATPSDPTSVVSLANDARNSIDGLEIYVVAIGPDAPSNDVNIRGIANSPSTYVSYVTSADQTTSAADNILNKICV